MEEIVYPKTMVVMLEQSQAKAKELGLALEQAQETIDRISLIAQVAQQESELRASEIKRLEKRIKNLEDCADELFEEVNRQASLWDNKDELDNLNKSL